MDLNGHLKSWLQFSKKERLGIAIVLTICMLTWILPVFFASDELPEDIFEITSVEIDQVIRIMDSSQKQAYNHSRRDTGIYGKNFGRPRMEYNKTHAPLVILDINKADSLALEQLPGIGAKLSSRIIRYRQRLGGFVSVRQLQEVYGVTDSLVILLRNRLKVEEGFQPEKIMINQADYKALRRLPYLDHQIIKAILAYRNAHGKIKNAQELGSIMIMEQGVLEKIKPYIAFSD